jgi:hypothetical protein
LAFTLLSYTFSMPKSSAPQASTLNPSTFNSQSGSNLPGSCPQPSPCPVGGTGSLGSTALSHAPCRMPDGYCHAPRSSVRAPEPAAGLQRARYRYTNVMRAISAIAEGISSQQGAGGCPDQPLRAPRAPRRPGPARNDSKVAPERISVAGGRTPFFSTEPVLH